MRNSAKVKSIQFLAAFTAALAGALAGAHVDATTLEKIAEHFGRRDDGIGGGGELTVARFVADARMAEVLRGGDEIDVVFALVTQLRY